MSSNPIYINPSILEQNPRITLHFYNDKNQYCLPQNYSQFISGISYTTQIPPSSLSSFHIFYIDNENNKILIQTEEQYNNFYKILSMNYLNSKDVFIELNQNNVSNNNNFEKIPSFNFYCHYCNINPINRVVFYCIPLKYYICDKCEETVGKNIGVPLVKICNYKALKEALQLEYVKPFTEMFNSKIKEGHNISSMLARNSLILNDIKEPMADLNNMNIINDNISNNINNF